MGNLAQAAVAAPSKAAHFGWRQIADWRTTLLIVLVAWLYAPIMARLGQQWWSDPNFSHGFFVPLFSVFVLWQERDRFKALPRKPSIWGLPMMLVAMGMLVLGVFGAENFLARISLVVLIAGLVVFFVGWPALRASLFPLLFLVLMVPIPAIILKPVTFALQILASKLAAWSLPVFGVPVFREGNIINLPAMPLEVADACSGIRSLLSLTTLAIIYGYVVEKRVGIRVVLALASIPIAVVANGFRIMGTGLLVQYWNPDKAQGFFHEFSGLVIFVVALLMLFALHVFINFAVRRKQATT